MCLKMSEIWHACPVPLSFCCSLAHSMLPATMKSHFLLPSYPTPLTEVQKNKLWYAAKTWERIVWVPGQQSRLQASFQFKVSFLPRDDLEKLKQFEQTEMEARSQGVDLTWQQAESKSVAEWRQVHDGTPACSSSYLFRREEILKKISLSLTIFLAIIHPIAGWQSRNVGDHEGLSQLFHYSSEEQLYLTG